MCSSDLQISSESYCSISNRTPFLAISRSISAEWTEDWLVQQIEEDWYSPSQLMVRPRSAVALMVNFDEGHVSTIPGTLSRWSKDFLYPSPSARGNLDTEQKHDLAGIGSWAQPIDRVAPERLGLRSRNLSTVAPRL